MYVEKRRSLWRPVILVLILTSVVLAACGAQLSNENWPGLAVSGERVYVSFGPGIYAIDVPEREIAWNYPAEFNAAVQFFAPVSVEDQRIVIGDFGRSGGMFSPGTTVTLYGLQEVNGGTPPVEWERDELAQDKVVAGAVQANGVAYIGTADNDVIALEADSGEELWRFSTGHSIWGMPVYHEGVVYVGSLDKSVYALDAETGEVMWETPLGGSITSHPVIHEDTLFVTSFDHNLYALDLGTGEEKWRSPAGDLVWGAPAVGDEGVFFGDIDGNVYAVSLNGESLWQAQAGGLIQSAPTYHEGMVFVTSGRSEGDQEELAGELLALDAATGEQLWLQQTPAPIFTSPVIVGDEVVVALLNDEILLLVYNLESGARTWEFIPPGTG